MPHKFQAPQRSKGLKAKAENVGSTKKLAVLDLKRATGIGIRMARLPVPWVDIRDAILTCDEEVLRTCEDVQTVLACIPNEEEKRMLEVHCGSGSVCFGFTEVTKFVSQFSNVQICLMHVACYSHSYSKVVNCQI